MKDFMKLNYNKIENTYPFIISAALIVAFTMVYQFSTSSYVVRFSGIKGEPDTPTGLMCMILPFAFYSLKRHYDLKQTGLKYFFIQVLIIAFIALNILAIIISGSRMGLLIVTIILICLFIKFIKILMKPKIMFIIAVILYYSIIQVRSLPLYDEIFSYIFDRTHSGINFLITGNELVGGSFSDRLHKNFIGLELFTQYPIFGHGLYSEYYILKNLTGDGWYHNSFLEILSGGGIITFILYILLHIYIIKNLILFAKFNSSGSFLLLSFIALILTNVFLSNTSDPLFWTLFLPFSMYIEWLKSHKFHILRMTNKGR